MTHVVDDVIDRIQIPPDGGLVDSLGANHTLTSAIADLIDNSIDAGATHVTVRLLTADDRLVQVEVLDDGRGMTNDQATGAMVIGKQRDYVPGSLGHFGIGLKAASFGHCDVLTIWTKAKGHPPTGRRIRKSDFSKDFSCEILSGEAAQELAHTRESITGFDFGTSVVWTHLRSTYRGRSADEARSWLQRRSDELRSHLGLTFHRLIESQRIKLEVIIEDADRANAGLGIPVLAINPFGYAASGHPDFPKTLTARVGRLAVSMECHVWPPKTDISGFRVGGTAGDTFQGFFIYRNDRLLQAGGWSDVATSSPTRQLARVLINDGDHLDGSLKMNPEKVGLRFDPPFHDAIELAVSDDGTSFKDFLAAAEETYARARMRNRRRTPVIRPEKGFASVVRKKIGQELTFIHGQGVDIKWRNLRADDFFEVDLEQMTLWLNAKHRGLFAPAGGSLNDAPVLKTLLFLLTHHLFEGQHLGARDKDQIVLWQSILEAAVRAEENRKGESE